MNAIVDVQDLRIVEVDDRSPPPDTQHAEILVVGGGLGGVAAALAACEAGRTVCLIEETAWLGGQATAQGVSALDENRYIETSGGTRSYLAFRAAIRRWYRDHTRLRQEAAAQKYLDPGQAWVSRLCFEPRVALGVIEELLRPFVTGGHLRRLLRTKAYAVGMDGQRVRHIDAVDLHDGRRMRLTADYVIDATELGDLLALGAAGFITGAESQADTGEPHAAEQADPDDVQSFTYPFAIERRPGETHRALKPDGYDRNRDEQPYTLTLHYATRGDLTYSVFEKTAGTHGSFWTYRRLIDASQFDDPAYPHDIAMINWPGNDYRGGNILVADPQEQLRHLRAARDLSLGLLYWLQHDVPRDDGEGHGYPAFKLRTDVMGTGSGCSKFPYIRESRRIVPRRRILEQDVTTDGPRAVHCRDSVGIGLYSIDLHESKRNRKQIINPARPFQIPLGALVPRSAENLLAGAKNIGTTHITNGCYRLHPIEWNIGEAAGEAAAFCVEHDLTPARLCDDPGSVLALQRRLVDRGVPIMWYDDVAVDDPLFARVQMLPFKSPEVLDQLKENLNAPA